MIDKAVQNRPNDGAIVDSLGWVMLRQGSVPEAVRTLERAVELEPEDASINGHLGDAYWAAGRKLEATYQWRRALIFNPAPDDAAKLEAKLQQRTAANGGERPIGSVPDRLTEPAPAKVNLYLHLTGRRDDGYHLLDSLVVFAGIGDTLSAAPAETLSLHVAGPFAAGLAGEPDNLVLRAARALAAEAGVTAGAHLVLDKHLPVASGIGGGSADAAAALRLLCRLWRLAPQPAALARLAAGLGADVPVCLAGSAARMGGVGERLGPAPVLPAVWHRAGQSRNPGGHRRGVPRAARPMVGAGGVARRLGRRGSHGRRPGRIAQRPGAACHRASPGDRRRPGRTRGDAGLPAGADERLGRHLLRPLSRCRHGSRGTRTLAEAGPVVLGRLAAKRLSEALPRAARDLFTPAPDGASPSGKATDFDSVIRRFDPSRPSQPGSSAVPECDIPSGGMD